MSEFTSRKRSGVWQAMGAWGELTEGETLSCCHCQFTRVLKKGSGQVWHWCGNCAGYHCGGVNCRECVPLEQRISNLEAGRPELAARPLLIAVPELPKFG